MEITNKYDVQNQDKHAFILRNNAVWGRYEIVWNVIGKK